MARLHHITHDSDLAKRKVNFFADYFCYAAETIGRNDSIEIENPLSSVEKIIFQLTENPLRCTHYIDSYLTHNSFQAYEQFDKLKSFKNLQILIQAYKKNGKAAEKINWIGQNPTFLRSLKRYRTQLRRLMFKKALDEIISYLRCVHQLEEHKIELISQTNLLVSEFVLNDRSKKDIMNVFERIITREVGRFPFPKSLKSPEEKENFIKNRNFQQQFDGIYNLLKEDPTQNYFFFRVYGIEAPEDFYFTYNRVSFCSPKHERLRTVVEKIHARKHLEFLNADNICFAIIKSEYSSIDIAARNAADIVRRELSFVNKVLDANGTLEKTSYLITSDFIDFGFHRNFADKVRSITKDEYSKLEDNPYTYLKNCPAKLKEPLIRNEGIYIDASVTKNVSQYWQYLETIVPPKKDDSKQVIDTVSHLLLLNAESSHKNSLHAYILNSLSPMTISSDLLGITFDRQLDIFNYPNSIDWPKLQFEIRHPFIQHLIEDYLRPFNRSKFQQTKSVYSRILWDTQAQRNATIHKGITSEPSIIGLTGTLPRLVTRLRWVLFDGIKKRVGSDFQEIVHNLKVKSEGLL